MITIHIGYNKDNFPKLDDSLFPDEQLIEFDKLLNDNEDKELKLFTNSPYIINYLNLLILKEVINWNKLFVFMVNKDGSKDNLKVQNTSLKLINGDILSETINSIYDEYANLLNKININEN